MVLRYKVAILFSMRIIPKKLMMQANLIITIETLNITETWNKLEAKFTKMCDSEEIIQIWAEFVRAHDRN